MRSRRNTRFVLAAIFTLFSYTTLIVADSGLETSIETILDEEGLTGVAWALIHEPGETSIGVSGLQDNRAGARFDLDTRFHVGSITKSVLATGILRLSTEGRIDLDAPVLRYLPNLFPDDPPARFSEVTVRQLLDHTAGLNDAHLWQMFSEHVQADTPLIDSFPDPSEQLQIRSMPGSRFSYSNMGYTLLGLVIEAITGERYESYLDQHLLPYLGMDSSTFEFTSQEGRRAGQALAWGHLDDGSVYAAAPVFLRPAGQFTTTAADLANYMAFLLGNGEVGGKPFVDKSLMRSRGEPGGTEAANAGLSAGYGLGLGRRDRHDKVGYCHGGNIVGFVAMFCVFPEDQKAFAYSVNTDSETANYSRFDRLFIDALDITDAVPPATFDPAPDTYEWIGRYVLSPNRFRTFEYLDSVFGSIRLAADGSQLTLSSMQQASRQLRPVGEYTYSANDRATASHALLRGDSGEYLISDGFRTYEKVASTYLFAHWVSITLGLIGLSWILVAGSISLVKNRVRMIHRPEAPAYFASIFLFAPIPFFLNQSFMALGDVTLASTILALATLLLPIGMLISLGLVFRSRGKSRLYIAHGIAALMVLQWCAVLASARILPFVLWA